MNGFVPVSKANLLEMSLNCLEAIEKDYTKKTDDVVFWYIEKENLRTTVPKWYRLWILPKPRFNICDVDSVVKYSHNRTYEMFTECPFKSLDDDKINSIKWVESLKALVDSNYAGEPIQLDLKTFKRISKPDYCAWVSRSKFYYTVSF